MVGSHHLMILKLRLQFLYLVAWTKLLYKQRPKIILTHTNCSFTPSHLDLCVPPSTIVKLGHKTASDILYSLVVVQLFFIQTPALHYFLSDRVECIAPTLSIKLLRVKAVESLIGTSIVPTISSSSIHIVHIRSHLSDNLGDDILQLLRNYCSNVGVFIIIVARARL
ncbi:hypothetical protein Tco_0382364 [Tanacetum coccineum]